MAVNSSKNNILTPNPPSLITSKWSHPIEGFVSHPKYTTPLRYDLTENVESIIEKSYAQLSESEVMLAHETSEKSAENIMESGFELEEKGSSPIRNKAIFGWIHKKDIGYFSKTEKNSATHTVLFSAPKSEVYISSYNTSAPQLLLGEITQEEYESKHVLNYSIYESIINESPSIVNHLNYGDKSLLPSK